MTRRRGPPRGRTAPSRLPALLGVGAIVVCMLLGAIGVRALLAQRATAVGGPYTLVDTHARVVSDADFRGRYTLIYFGYTHCIDVCPLTLATVVQALQTLGPRAKTVVPIFITVDPERDTPAVVGEYVSHFSPDIVGLTGSVPQIDAVVGEFHVMARRREMQMPAMGNAYLMDHSSVLFLMDGQNRLVSIMPVDTSARAVVASLERVLPPR